MYGSELEMLMNSNRVRRRVILAAFYIFVMVVRWRDDDGGQVEFGIAFAAIVIGIEVGFDAFRSRRS